MRIRDPKTGEVFEDMERARRHFCNSSDVSCRQGCPLYSRKETCKDFAARYPNAASQLMGYALDAEEGDLHG